MEAAAHFSIVSWIVSCLFSMIAVGLLIFLFTKGKMSPMADGWEKRNFWSWTVTFALCLNIPVVGWMLGGYFIWKYWPNFPR